MTRQIRLVELFSRIVAWTAVPIYLAGIVTTFWVESRFARPSEASAIELAALLLGFGTVTAMGAILV